MYTYGFVFKCENCTKELRELVNSTEALTKDELNQTQFNLRCRNCEWLGKLTGFQAYRIEAILRLASVCA